MKFIISKHEEAEEPGHAQYGQQDERSSHPVLNFLGRRLLHHAAHVRHLPKHEYKCAQIEEYNCCNGADKTVPYTFFFGKPTEWIAWFSVNVQLVSRTKSDACD